MFAKTFHTLWVPTMTHYVHHNFSRFFLLCRVFPAENSSQNETSVNKLLRKLLTFTSELYCIIFIVVIRICNVPLICDICTIEKGFIQSFLNFGGGAYIYPSPPPPPPSRIRHCTQRFADCDLAALSGNVMSWREGGFSSGFQAQFVFAFNCGNCPQ